MERIGSSTMKSCHALPVGRPKPAIASPWAAAWASAASMGSREKAAPMPWRVWVFSMMALGRPIGSYSSRL